MVMTWLIHGGFLWGEKAKILSMQGTTEKGRLLEVATKLYLQEQGFKTYFWSEWAPQKGLPLQDRKPS